MTNAVMTKNCGLGSHTLSSGEFEKGLKPDVKEIQEETEGMHNILQKWFNGEDVF